MKRGVHALGEPAPGNGRRLSLFEKQGRLCPNLVMPRYYFGENAGRPIRVGSKQFAFDILSCAGGTHQGVVAVKDEDIAPFLSVASRVVTEISESEYTSALEKKKNNRRSQPSPDLSSLPRRLGPPLKGAGAVVVDGTSVKRPEEAKLPDSISDAVDLGRADTPMSDVQPKKPSTRRENHRQKRGTE